MTDWPLTLFAAVSFLQIGIVVDYYLLKKYFNLDPGKFWGLGLGFTAVVQMIAGLFNIPITDSVAKGASVLIFSPWIFDPEFRSKIKRQTLLALKHRPKLWEIIISSTFLLLLFFLTFSQIVWGHDAFAFWLSKGRAFWIDSGINQSNIKFFWPYDQPLLWPLVASWFYKLTGLIDGYFVRIIPFLTFVFIGWKMKNFLWKTILLLTPFMLLTLVAPEYGGNADLLVSFFVLLATVDLVHGSLVHTGIFLGLAALTKNDSLPVLVAFPILSLLFLRQEKDFKSGILAALSFLGFDWIFKIFFGLGSRYLERNISEVFTAHPIQKNLTYTALAIREDIRQIYKWSLGWWLIIFVSAVNFRKIWQPPRILVPFLLIVIYLISLFWVYFVTAEDQATQIATSLSRVLLQIFPALIYLCSYLQTITPLKSFSATFLKPLSSRTLRK